MKQVKAATVDEYIGRFHGDVKGRLDQIREVILKTAPDAVESISYAMPAYKLGGRPLVYFAGYDNHIGLYATPTGHAEFVYELSKYKQGKGSVQFPNGDPLPLDLIERMIAFKSGEAESSSL